MKVIKSNTSFEIDVKRLHLPIKVKSKCPKCGTKFKIDLRDEYLDYPRINDENTMYYCCVECSEEIEIKYELDVNLIIKQ